MQQTIQISLESVRYLKERYVTPRLRVHTICSDLNITLDQLLQSLPHNSNHNNNTTNPVLQTDELGMTALHLLCLNPNTTPDMFKIIATAGSQAAAMQAQMVTHEEYDRIHELVYEAREMVTPIKLWLKMRCSSYDDANDFFDEQDHITLDAVLQRGLEWNNLQSIMNIQFHGSDFLVVKNETNL